MDALGAVQRVAGEFGGRPSGTVTFLFTDIEGSTERWDRYRDAMARALRAHDEIMRAAVAKHDGVVFKTVGDAFCAAFARAESAVAAAVTAQRALGQTDFSDVEGLRVRMALNTGTADERDGDYFGPALNRVARLLHIASGGQVLLAATTTDLVRGLVPAGVFLRDLGEHRLKDLSVPERVAQLDVEGLRSDFPALRSLDAHPHNLPLEVNGFIGRERDLDAIVDLLAAAPLVTLAGAGGIGKTRCALHVGASVLERFPDGVRLIELASTTDAAGVVDAVARVLGVMPSAQRPLLDSVVHYLQTRRLLLIFDNCEQVVAGAAACVMAILRGCAHVKMLATSRQALDVTGETVYRLPPLDLPAVDDWLSVGRALEYGSIALFVARAGAADQRFALTEANANIIAGICRDLDGIALAIELAAARIRVLSPKALAASLRDRFRVLTGGQRDAPARHQTARALIDWSYERLTPAEQTFLCRLSIFVNGWTLETATGVCVDETIDALDILDLTASLVDKSLVIADTGGDEARYRFHELTRQYAREKLAASDDDARCARAHAAAFIELAERCAYAAYETMADQQWYALIEAERGNWRAALDWTLTSGNDIEGGQRLIGAIAPGLGAEGWYWLHAALAAVGPHTPPHIAARLHRDDALFLGLTHQHAASLAAAERALAASVEIGDLAGAAVSRSWIGRATSFLGANADGEALLEEAIATTRALNMRKATGFALSFLGSSRAFSGRIDAARRDLSEALAIFRDVGADQGLASVALVLAEIEFTTDPAAALTLADESLRASRRVPNNGFLIAAAHGELAVYALALGRLADARQSARDQLAVVRDMQLTMLLPTCILHFAALAAAAQTHESLLIAARLAGYVAARQPPGTPREPSARFEDELIAAALRARLDDNARLAAAADGERYDDERAIHIALDV
jgi:predicted ATPase/class 3 adenylate cyclase